MLKNLLNKANESGYNHRSSIRDEVSQGKVSTSVGYTITWADNVKSEGYLVMLSAKGTTDFGLLFTVSEDDFNEIRMLGRSIRNKSQVFYEALKILQNYKYEVNGLSPNDPDRKILEQLIRVK